MSGNRPTTPFVMKLNVALPIVIQLGVIAEVAINPKFTKPKNINNHNATNEQKLAI